VPILFIFNTSSYQYAVQELITAETKSKGIIDFDIQEFLDEIKLGKVEFYGGQTYFRQLRRPFWELYRAVIEMFYEAPFLSLLIFGFPFGVISVVFYFLCCVDSTEQMDEEYVSNSESEDDVNEEDYCLEDEDAAILAANQDSKKTQWFWWLGLECNFWIFCEIFIIVNFIDSFFYGKFNEKIKWISSLLYLKIIFRVDFAVGQKNVY